MVSPFTPEFYRQGRPLPKRTLGCRACNKDMTCQEDGDGRWYHDHDGSLACVDPETLRPYGES